MAVRSSRSSYLVGSTRGGQITRFDVFGPDDLDAARACSAELAAAAAEARDAGLVIAGALVTQPSNAVTRANERGIAFMLARDYEGFAGLLAPDVRWEDRRPVVGGYEVVGRMPFSTTSSGGPWTWA